MANDHWATPPEVFERIQELVRLPIVFDVCASSLNAKTHMHFNEGHDALSMDWYWEMRGRMNGPQQVSYALWMNPPYSNPTPWVRKANVESTKGLIIVGLLPDDRSTKWYQDNIEGQATICFIPDRRISFINAETGKVQKGNNKGSVIPLWTPWRTGRTQYVRFNL